MDTEENGNGHFDLLTAALSESGLGDLVGFGDSDETEEQPPIQVETAGPPVAQSTPVRPAPSQFITVRASPAGHSPAHIISTLPSSSQTPVKVIQSGGTPQTAKTPITKIIRLPANSSVLQKYAGGSIATSTPGSGQRVVVPAGAATGRIITIAPVTNGGSTPVAKNIIVNTQPRTTTSHSAQRIVVTPQGVKNGVQRRILVAQNGPSTSSAVSSLAGQVLVANVTQSPQAVRTVSSPQVLQAGVQKVVINQGNGRVLHVKPQTPLTTGATSLVTRTVRVTSPGLQTRLIHSPSLSSLSSAHSTANVIQPSPGQLKPIGPSRTGSQLILSQAGLSGAKVISTNSAASPGPSAGTLHHAFSMPALTTDGSRSRSNSPVFGLGNIPTVVSQKVNVRNYSGAGASGSKEGIWTQEDMQIRAFKNASATQPQQRNVQQMAEDAEEESEDLGHAETYAEYMPTKVPYGQKHPDQVVESSSLSSVEPPDVDYRLSIPEVVMDKGLLSALQLEAITYACQRHKVILRSGERAGYLIGDGAGVGKGRTVAGIIYENYLQGRKKALWLSVSADLKVDAERDLMDIGASKITVHAMNKFKYQAKLSAPENGSVKKGVIFITYSSLIGKSSMKEAKYHSRMKQLLKWCGKDFEGVIIFDECHKAKNLCPTGSGKPTQTGKAVLDLQNRLPKARIVYASATGASEPKNMAYMTRLGLWGRETHFKEFTDFVNSVEKRGVGAMEMVAMDLKLRGMYIARQLSFKGTSFQIEEVKLDEDFKKIYNKSVDVWMEARSMFQKAADLLGADHRMRKSMWGQFWSSHQRFFKYLCISAKVEHCVRLTREAVKTGKCVVIGLQSTGEARTQEMVEKEGEDLNEFVSTAKGVFQALVEKHFPAADRSKTLSLLSLGGLIQKSDMAPGFKRKRDEDDIGGPSYKRTKLEKDSSDDDNDDDSSASNFSDLSDSGSSSSDSDEETNPFGSDSDSEEDPWVKKSKKKRGKAPKPKKKKEKKKKTKKKKKEVSDDDEDEYCDRKLAMMAQMKKSTSLIGDGKSEEDNFETRMHRAVQLKEDLTNQVERLGEELPANTLDVLVDLLGGPDMVAEMTGRKSRVVQNEDGIQYESRSETQVAMENLNLKEKERFMDGEKDIAIISEAASSGISLHADRRAINQKRRVHITLELPWSADRAIQQFGRTHRSNQVSAPDYMFLISDLAGERRFASTVAKRLESLGALTHGDRRATESRDLSRFNIDNRYGRMALETVMKSVLGNGEIIVDIPVGYTKEKFFEEVKQAMEGVGLLSYDRAGLVSVEKDYCNISKFLNRLLGMPTDLQNALFDYFNNTLSAIILDAKRSGRWDMGILDLGSGQEVVQRLQTQVFVGSKADNNAKTELSIIQVERGMVFEKAQELWRKCNTVEEGFYLSSQERNSKRTSCLVVVQQTPNKKKEKVYSLYRPNTGLQARAETLEEIKKKYKKVLPDVAEKWWTDQFNHSSTVCSHAYWSGNCKKVNAGLPCEIGLRTRQYHVLSGSVLSVWASVESVLSSMPGGNASKMQIVRLKTGDGQKIVGSLIPNHCVPPLVNVLTNASTRNYVDTHHQTLQSAVNGLRNSSFSSTSTHPSSAFPAASSSSSTTSNGLTTHNRESPVESGDDVSEQASGVSSETPRPPAEPLLSMPIFEF